MAGEDLISVRVAVRIRPCSEKEIREGCVAALDKVEGRPQVYFRSNKDKAFTYDFAYDSESGQKQVFQEAVQPLIQKLFKGYNVTVLAYGQTGSGKTYTMGTEAKTFLGDDVSSDVRGNDGIIPRAVSQIFQTIDAMRKDYDFRVRVAFVELYKETLYDLLAARSGSGHKEECTVDLREDVKNGGVRIPNLTEVTVCSLADTLRALEFGSNKRSTAATAMNLTSSRSHAIFSVFIEGVRREASLAESDDDEPESITCKFHLVDLAGSERAKRTQATGDRYKEGVAINMGLLCLGNVISALGDEGGPKSHIPYRDSKLTRLLQDSLGGNSHTLMIACVSPADSNVEETLSTLRYADRARKIKNKPIVNMDGKDELVARLRREVQELKARLTLGDGGSGSCVPRASSEVAQAELKDLRTRNAQLEAENRELTSVLVACQDEMGHMNEKLLLADSLNDKMRTKLGELLAQAEEASAKESTAQGALETIGRKIREIVDVQKDGEKTLSNHDASRFARSLSDSTNNSEATEDDSQNDEDFDEEDYEESKRAEEEFAASHALKQNALASQLANLNKVLAQKEQLAGAMMANDQKIQEMRQRYEKSLKALEDELAKVQSEHSSLVSSQPHHSAEGVGSKLAEQRRKRIQELEQQMQELRQKVLEQQRAIKMNEKNATKVKTLTDEILQMKQDKVKLIRQMKEDSEKVRAWKLQKEREVMQLKQTERKQMVRIAKMETMHSKRQGVLQRKMEEAVAANKRLQEVIQKQKEAKAIKAAAPGAKQGFAGTGERIRSMVNHELDVVISIKDASNSRQQLLKDRKHISKELNDLSKKSRFTLSTAEREDLDKRKKELQAELDVRNVEITSLQKQIMDLEQDSDNSSGKQWWDSIQSMVEARMAIEHLFNKVVDQASQGKVTMAELEELRQLYEETSKNTNSLEEEISRMKADHGQELARISNEYEDNQMILLSKLANPETYSLKDGDIQKFSDLHEKIRKMLVEEEAKANLSTSSALASKQMRQKSSWKHIKSGDPEERMTLKEFLSDEEDSEEEDDVIDSMDYDDPDWKKTPLYRRLKKVRESTLRSSSVNNLTKRKLNENEEEDSGVRDVPAAKRGSGSGLGASFDGGCSCKTGCKNRWCKCRKGSLSCSDDCKCTDCQNRPGLDGAAKNNDDTEGTVALLNSTFDVGGSGSKAPPRLRQSDEDDDDDEDEENSLKTRFSAVRNRLGSDDSLPSSPVKRGSKRVYISPVPPVRQPLNDVTVTLSPSRRVIE